MYDCSDVDDDCFENWFDCAGECAGTAQELTYCFDSDGDGFGQPGTETVYCDASLEDGWVLDCSDLNDDIFVKIIFLMNALFVIHVATQVMTVLNGINHVMNP